jgi:hypothetical protein
VVTSETGQSRLKSSQRRLTVTVASRLLNAFRRNVAEGGHEQDLRSPPGDVVAMPEGPGQAPSSTRRAAICQVLPSGVADMNAPEDYTPSDYFEFLMSRLYDSSALDPEHERDLDKSGITVETRTRHKIRSCPPDMIDPLLGFYAPNVRSAYLIPFPDPRGGWMDHVRLKIFASDAEREMAR